MFRGYLSPVQKLRQRRGLGQTARQTHTHTHTHKQNKRFRCGDKEVDTGLRLSPE